MVGGMMTIEKAIDRLQKIKSALGGDTQVYISLNDGSITFAVDSIGLQELDDDVVVVVRGKDDKDVQRDTVVLRTQENQGCFTRC